VRRVDVAVRRVLPAGHEDWQVALAGGDEPRVGGVDLVVFVQAAAAQDPVEELVREDALAGGVVAGPLVEDRVLDAAVRLLLGNARSSAVPGPAIAPGRTRAITASVTAPVPPAW